MRRTKRPVSRHKHVGIDQGKLEKAKKLLDSSTETEALDRPLALVSEGEIDATLRSARGTSCLKKMFR
jgi:hypothetical protein